MRRKHGKPATAPSCHPTNRINVEFGYKDKDARKFSQHYFSLLKIVRERVSILCTSKIAFVNPRLAHYNNVNCNLSSQHVLTTRISKSLLF